ncbi:MAG: restriction endonuclease subunit M, partial [Candidatus Methanospirareceae archaeon]
MAAPENIRSSFRKLHEKLNSAKEISEEDLRIAFVKSGILEALGYEGELTDIRFEKNIRGKRSDLLACDEYQNVVFVVEFKKPKELDVERDFAQLWERYVKPLKARYGVLTDGLELMIYERVNSNWEQKLSVNLAALAVPECEELSEWLRKPRIERTKIEAVLNYFALFDDPAERVNLSSEIAQQHFFESFELKAGSRFANLVEKTIGLFDFELERSKFLKSAYNFWKISYAKKPEKIPENWRRIMGGMGLDANEENLFKFMFCLESAYSLFTRLILAKACEDYQLPYVEFSRFIKTEIEQTSYRGDITLLAWAITTQHLIESMKQRLVKSVFEGDIFYWWEDSYRDIRAGDALYSPRFEKQKGRFGEALADLILTLYKFDFSEIVGDPLGTLYQRYFDKETRKALGEFYTPQEVVEYILDAVGYEGRGVIGKRLLDPACGSGTFLVEALRRYLKASEQIADEKGWSKILEELCNEYHIVGFDIHPFATFMAQMQFMLVLIPAYKRAMDEDRRFVLNRLPIFRTDSLIDETKGETKKVTLETFEEGSQYLLIDTGLPVEGGNLQIQMPYFKHVIANTDLLNVEEYFAALQAVFDTVKAAAWQDRYTVTGTELEHNFKRYVTDKDWNGLVSYFTPYVEHFLQKFHELKETFGDGKLIKSLEDIMLAAVLKNYVQYDFVVGNPPYVRVQMLDEKHKDYLKEFYKTAKGKFDLYILFIERGVLWLKESGRFGFIVSNQFMVTDYGSELRSFILNHTKINQIINFGDSGVFSDATNYPAILILQKISDKHYAEENIIRSVRVYKPTKKIINNIRENIQNQEYSNGVINIFNYPQTALDLGIWTIVPEREKCLFEKINENSSGKLNAFVKKIFQGIKTGNDSVFYLNTSSEIKRDPETDNLLIKVTPQNSTASFFVEKELLRPLLKGNEIRKY